MKLNKYSLALILGFSTLFSCSDRMDLLNPNQQTSSTFGFNANDLEESVIAAYNHIRMEGSYARVGYTIDVCRGDEAWNSSQVWYLPFDDLNAEVTSDITWWPWREWYYTINVCNFAISRCGGHPAGHHPDPPAVRAVRIRRAADGFSHRLAHRLAEGAAH